MKALVGTSRCSDCKTSQSFVACSTCHLETDPPVPGLVAPVEDPLELVLAHLGPHQRPAQLHEVLEVEVAVTVRVQASEGDLHPVIGILDVRAAAMEF